MTEQQSEPRPAGPSLTKDATAGRPAPDPGPSVSTVPRPVPRASGAPRPGTAAGARNRRARLRLKRLDPWSVFVLSLVISAFLAVVIVVAVVVLYGVLDAAGVPDSINTSIAELTRKPGEAEPSPFLSAGRAVEVALVLAVVDVVLVTALATLGAVLYNLCAGFTGGLEVTLAEHDG